MKLDSLEKSRQTGYVKKFLRKIAEGYIAGTVLFIALKIATISLNKSLGLDIVESTIKIDYTVQKIVFELIYGGKLGAGHLWFLPALFYSVALIYGAYKFDRFRELMAASIVFHAVGILSRSYLYLEGIPVPRDDMLFFGLVFTCTGFYIRKKDFWSSLDSSRILAVGLIFNLLHFLERALLSVYSLQEPYFWANYSFLTLPAATSVFLYFLKKKELGKNSNFNRYGKNTLWIYVIHPIPVGFLIGLLTLGGESLNLNPMSSLTVALVITVVAYFGSAEIVLHPWMKKISGLTSKIRNLRA